MQVCAPRVLRAVLDIVVGAHEIVSYNEDCDRALDMRNLDSTDPIFLGYDFHHYISKREMCIRGWATRWAKRADENERQAMARLLAQLVEDGQPEEAKRILPLPG